ncbi:MAG: ATP-binding protein [Gaiellaceae bacterium]
MGARTPVLSWLGNPGEPPEAEAERLRETDAWIAWVRLAAVPFAAVQVLLTPAYPDGYEVWAWIATALLAAGAGVFLFLTRLPRSLAERHVLGAASLAFDIGVVAAFVLVYSFEEGSPILQLLYLPLVEGALRYGLAGGLAVPFAQLPVVLVFEWWRTHRFDGGAFDADQVTFPLGLQLIMGLVVGWLVDRLRRESGLAGSRAREAELLRDQIGRRADQLEAVNRCARALSSTLDPAEAFRRFLREAQTAFHFDRLSLVLVRGDRAEVLAIAGQGDETVLPAGTNVPLEGTALAEVCSTGRTVVRDDMAEPPRFSEDSELVDFGLRSRVAAPLPAGDRILGMLSVSRRNPSAFSADDVSLITLLGRQVATAVENIQSFEAERNAAEELRRLSALRADFVSLVSHELRAPMASVIGCAATLRSRWHVLSPDQRESFLALIEDETSRLAALIGDVLDTSRMDAGTFSYSFDLVDVEALVREAVAATQLGHEEIRVRAEVASPLPAVRGDRERLRQVLLNLLGNAVKYTVLEDEIEVRAVASNGRVEIAVSDHGPGIAPADQRLIFEKFGRATPSGSTPGAGLGLFIARSIVEAHDGSLEVESTPGAGSTFVLSLPAGI